MLDPMWPVRAGRRGALRALALAPILVGLMSCSSGERDAPAREPAQRSETATESSTPVAGRKLYVDPRSPAALQAARWRSEGRTADAAAMARLAKRPTAVWVADGTGVTARAREATQKAAAAERTALLVAYHVPGRDCGSYSAGGSGSPEAYRAWVRGFARGIGPRRAIVILEPDAIPQAVTESCLSAASRAERYALLADAVRTFAALPNVAVYIDAGNPGWVRPVEQLVRPLRAAGIEAADGFALNVSNFYRTGTVIRYGRALSRRLGGAHFVIDTSRNGNGPSRAGAPPAGQWWPEYALQLVRNG
jgi:endoglucanase